MTRALLRRVQIADQKVRSSARVKSKVSDLAALEFARGQLSAIGSADADAAATHPLYSRALSELDRLIDQARRAR